MQETDQSVIFWGIQDGTHQLPVVNVSFNSLLFHTSGSFRNILVEQPDHEIMGIKPLE